MTLALDTDVLVHWTLRDSPFHQPVARLLRHEVGERRQRIALTHQVVWEYLHVVTDSRRFAKPLEMSEASAHIRVLATARDSIVVGAGPLTLETTLSALETHGLGRKRILDTALAMTLQEAGITRLFTLNARHYRVFDAIEVLTLEP